MKKIITVLIFLPILTFAQTKGYGKIDLGAAIFPNNLKPSAAFTIGFNPAQQVGIGTKIQYVQDFGALFMGEFRGFAPAGKITISGAFNAGEKFYKSTGTFAYGLDGTLLFSQNKSKPFITIGGLFLKNKIGNIEIKYNAFYAGTGVLF